LPRPTLDEFKTALLSKPIDEVVANYVLAGDPYAFEAQPNALQRLRSHVAAALSVDAANVIVVGSAQVGFSLSPVNFPRRFSEESDIDVAIIDETLFDRVWHTLLKWHYPRRLHLPTGDWKWTSDRRKELYWGWFVPDKIRFTGLSLPAALKPIRDCSSQWFNTFRSLSRYPEFSGRDVSGRLYRTWEHVNMYQSEGLRQIREVLNRQGIAHK
jgi:hypothetical protein